MKEKANGKEMEEYSSKDQTASTTTVSETLTHSKGSPAHTSFSMSESASDRRDHKRTVDNFSMERESSHDARHSKKHKRSKKKKLKDKERHRDSG